MDVTRDRLDGGGGRQERLLFFWVTQDISHSRNRKRLIVLASIGGERQNILGNPL